MKSVAELREMFSRDAEQAVLGAVMLDADALLDVQALGIRVDHFGAHAHQRIWAAMQRLSADGGAIDPITIADALAGEGQLEASGGLAYLGDLMRGTASAANATAYARRMIERHQEREWYIAGREIVRIMIEADGATHEQRVGAAQAVVTALSSEDRPRTLFSIADAVRRFVELVEERHDNPGIHGVCTGFRHVDLRLQGLQPGDLLVIAGRPAMGKTTYAMNIAHHAASAQQLRVLVFSLEMPAHQLAMRMVAAQGPLKMGLLKSGKVLDYSEQTERLSSAAIALSSLPLLIDDQGGLTLGDIATRARREHRRGQLGLVVIDYLQLIESPAARGSRNDAVSDISRGLKGLAKELGCPVIVLSQLSRKCEERGNKRPIPSDLRDSGAVEQDADLIQFVYRDRVYNEATPVGDQAEIITAKQRNGECGTDYLVFDGAHNRFREGERSDGQYSQHEQAEYHY